MASFRDAMSDDLAVFMDIEEMGEEVTWISSNGVEVTFLANVFDDEDEFAKSRLVNVWCKTSDVPNIAKKDIMIIKGVSLDIVDFRADEFGDITKIFVNKGRS